MSIPDRAAAMRNYLVAIAKGRRPVSINDDMIASLVPLRQSIRRMHGGGGMCHIVTDHHDNPLCHLRLNVTYLSEDGLPITWDHYVNFLPDGTIIDPTANQHGEGDIGVKIVGPDDPGLGRYRPEFDDDCHPDCIPEFEPFAADWTGALDWIAGDRLISERGEGWWLDDKTALLEYWREQASNSHGFTHDSCRAKVAELESAIANESEPLSP